MTSSVPTLKEIREAHSWKRDYERFLPVSRFLFRPVSFPVTWLAIRLGLTSEGVSWLSGIVGLAGCIFLMSEVQTSLVTGIGLLMLFNLLDCVDGGIARTMKTQNPYGRFLDSTCGGIIDLIFWAVIGIMAFRNPEYVFTRNIPSFANSTWLIIGILTCFLSIWLVYVEQTFDSLLRPSWEMMNTSESSASIDWKTQVNIQYTPSATITVLRIINNNLRVRESHYIVLLIAFIGRFIDLFLATFFFYYLASNVILMAIYSFRGAKVKDHLRKTDH